MDTFLFELRSALTELLKTGHYSQPEIIYLKNLEWLHFVVSFFVSDCLLKVASLVLKSLLYPFSIYENIIFPERLSPIPFPWKCLNVSGKPKDGWWFSLNCRCAHAQCCKAPHSPLSKLIKVNKELSLYSAFVFVFLCGLYLNEVV